MAAFDGITPKTLHRRKNLADISYRSRGIAHFVPNFVVMAAREGTGVNLNDTIRLAGPKNHRSYPRTKNYNSIL